MQNTWFGVVSQKQPVIVSVTPALTLKTVYSGTTFLTDVSMYWDGNTSTPCDTIYFDVSSNSAWTVSAGGGVPWTLSTYSGSAGVTNCSASYVADIIPESYTFNFKIGVPIYAHLNMIGASGCA